MRPRYGAFFLILFAIFFFFADSPFVLAKTVDGKLIFLRIIIPHHFGEISYDDDFEVLNQRIPRIYRRIKDRVPCSIVQEYLIEHIGLCSRR